MVTMDLFEAIARVGVFVVTAVLFILTFIAYRQVGSPRMRWVAASFGIFLILGTVLLLEVLSTQINNAVTEGMDYSIGLLALLVLAVGLLRGEASSAQAAGEEPPKGAT